MSRIILDESRILSTIRTKSFEGRANELLDSGELKGLLQQ